MIYERTTLIDMANCRTIAVDENQVAEAQETQFAMQVSIECNEQS